MAIIPLRMFFDLFLQACAEIDSIIKQKNISSIFCLRISERIARLLILIMQRRRRTADYFFIRY